MSIGVDGVYDRTHPWQVSPEYVNAQGVPGTGPAPSKEEARVSDQLIAQQYQVPPSPNPMFRARFGYRTTAYTIQDVIDIDEIVKEPRPYNDWGGGVAAMQGSNTNSLAQL